MTVDLRAAEEFMASHARVLDRRRFALAAGAGDAAQAVAALDAYRNPDGGYGWGLEPDLRSPESQPGAALHAFEVFEEIAPTSVSQAGELCDWLDTITLDGGGVPFALPVGISAGSAPWWTESDKSVPSLQITAVTAAAAHRLAASDGTVAAHPWLARATEYCMKEIEAVGDPFAYVLAFFVRFADALHDSSPAEAERLLDHLGTFVPADGKVAVRGGAEGETLHPLDLAPYPARPARVLFDDSVIVADLDRLAALQQDDGGWIVDFRKVSPAGSLDWRGYATVDALDILRRNGRLTR
jgi:hypothetical protein